MTATNNIASLYHRLWSECIAGATCTRVVQRFSLARHLRPVVREKATLDRSQREKLPDSGGSRQGVRNRTGAVCDKLDAESVCC